MPDDYATYVEARYQGEVFGEAFFGAMADACEDPENTRKLRALEQLERETKERLHPEVVALGLPDAPDAERLAQAEAIGPQMGAAPWADILRGMQPELTKFVADFEQAEHLAPPGREELLRHVTAHERALLEFVERELAGDAESLAPVTALLRA